MPSARRTSVTGPSAVSRTRHGSSTPTVATSPSDPSNACSRPPARSTPRTARRRHRACVDLGERQEDRRVGLGRVSAAGPCACTAAERRSHQLGDARVLGPHLDERREQRRRGAEGAVEGPPALRAARPRDRRPSRAARLRAPGRPSAGRPPPGSRRPRRASRPRPAAPGRAPPRARPAPGRARCTRRRRLRRTRCSR